MSRIPSPARSQGAPVTPRRHKSRTRSVGSPARSTTSGRLSALIQFRENNKDSFVLSPAPSRRSVLNDDTDIEEPRRTSWWKKLADNSRDVMEVLNDNKVLETNEAVEEYIDIEVLSQEKKHYSIDIPESSDSESISSIIIPQRKLFTQKDQGHNKYSQLVGTRETLAQLHKSHVADKTVNVPSKNLFGQGTKSKAKPIFPAALLNLSPNKTVNKTKENVAVEVKAQARNLFGNRLGTKRKNMFADFIVSESEDEISEIQPRVFGFPQKVDTRRESGNSRGKRELSPTSSVTTDIETDDWKMLPSSTMVENQIEDMMAVKTPVKRAKLSKLLETKESETKTTAELIEKDPSDEEQELKYDDDDDKSEENEKNHEVQNMQDEQEFVGDNGELNDIRTQSREIKAQSEIDGRESEIKDHEDSDILNQNKEKEEQSESEINEQDDAEEDEIANEDQVESEAEHNESEMEIQNESEVEEHEESDDEAPKRQSEQQNESVAEAQNENVAEMHESDHEIEDDAHQSDKEEIEENEVQNDNDKENEDDEAQNESEVEMQKESVELQDESEEEQQNESIDEQDEIEDEAQNESSVMEDDEQNESAENEEDMEDEAQNESAEVQEKMENDSQNETAEIQEEMENDSQNESAEIQEEMEEDAQNESQEAQEGSEDEIHDSNDHQASDNEQERNETHDTTGRYRKKNETKVNSPEAILHDKTNQLESFTAEGRNTSIRKTTMLKNLNIRPSLAPPRESTGLSDGTRNSSAEGSGWDSHRTTRKTLRQTFGKDFTPRKSLRALVMEKSAKRQTALNVTAKFPQANSTELPEASIAPDDSEFAAEPNHDVSKRTRQTTLEMYLQKIKKQNLDRKLKMEEAVRNSLKAPSNDVLNPFKVPSKPIRKLKVASKPKAKQLKSTLIPLDDLPAEVIEDMKYKPPRRFQPSNASWITKRLYKFLESKLESKYDYKARVRAEKLVETIYQFSKDLRRVDVANIAAVDALKQEMARLDVVKTHFDFYQFFHEYMPREIRVKVVPDVVNKINVPRHGVFSDIIRGNTVQG